MARILVVDDDMDILKMAERVLAISGHTTVVAADALKAMEILNSTTFDMLISDVNMPHYSGFELIKTVRGQEHLKDISIAMLTGLRERKDVERAIQAGADDYIVKPIDPMLLTQKIDSLFEKRPPSQHPEVVFSEDGVSNSAELKVNLTIRSISELGLSIETNLPFPEGTTVELGGYFFENTLQIESPPCRVLSQKKITSDLYQAELIFLGANEYQLKRVRQWIFSHGSMIKKGPKADAA